MGTQLYMYKFISEFELANQGSSHDSRDLLFRMFSDVTRLRRQSTLQFQPACKHRN
jgi:hypothetical protein